MVADLHANVPGVYTRFGEFHCCDGDYLYDEFGDLCGASEGNSADNSSGDGVHLGTTAKEGNMIDLTNDRSKLTRIIYGLQVLLLTMIVMLKLSTIQRILKKAFQYLQITYMKRAQRDRSTRNDTLTM